MDLSGTADTFTRQVAKSMDADEAQVRRLLDELGLDRALEEVANVCGDGEKLGQVASLENAKIAFRLGRNTLSV